MSRVEVVAGIITDRQGRILLAKRADHQHQGGKWEFPGGKIEAGEDPKQALCRELHEELSIKVQADACHLFRQVQFDYPDKQVNLKFYLIRQFFGMPAGMEGQPLQWVNQDQAAEYELPKANKPVMDALLANWPD